MKKIFSEAWWLLPWLLYVSLTHVFPSHETERKMRACAETCGASRVSSFRMIPQGCNDDTAECLCSPVAE